MDAGSVTPSRISAWSLPYLDISDNNLGDAVLLRRQPGDAVLSRKQPGYDGEWLAPPTADIGALSALPLEILTEVVLCLDLVSVAALRQVNRAARQTVDSVPQYAFLARHCFYLLQAIAATEASHFSLQSLYSTLCTENCVACGAFGSYLYVITCVRVCFHCFTRDRRFLPLLGKHASAVLGCSRKALHKWPHIRSIPGQYADGKLPFSNGIRSSTRISLWDRAAVLSAGTAQTPVQEKPDRHDNDPRRFMAIVTVPYFEPPSRQINWGLYCVGCRDSVDPETHYRKEFSKCGFIEHLVRNGPVQFDKGRVRHVPNKARQQDD